MPPTGTPPTAITPQGVRDGDPQVLAALATRRGPAVLAFAQAVCEPFYVVRAAADAFARFRSAVAAPGAQSDLHPDALLLRCARRAALDLAPRGPDLGCGPAIALLVARAERTISPADAALLQRHVESCDHCRGLDDSLAAADRAYRDADDTALDPAALAPMVAALAAAAPVRLVAAPEGNGAGPAAPVADEALAAERAPGLEPEPPAPQPEPAAPQPEPAAPEPEAAAPQPEPAVPEPEPASVEVRPEPPPLEEARRITGAPQPYYEVLPPPSPERAPTGRRAADGAVSAAATAASLTRRARAAARRRFERAIPATPVDPASSAHEPEPFFDHPAPLSDEAAPFPDDPAPFPAEAPHASDDTTRWDQVDPIEPVLIPEPELQEYVARAEARHYRRRGHSLQEGAARPDRKPPRLLRPARDGGTHLPLRAHGLRDLALPAGLVVLAVVIIMAVSGVFGGGSETPPTGTQPVPVPEVSRVSQSVTSISLADAQRIAARSTATPTATATNP